MPYISVAYLRAEGVSESLCPSDLLNSRIAIATELINSRTGLFFEKRSAISYKIDGPGHPLLPLPVPPVSVDSITKVTISDVEVDASLYEVRIPQHGNRRFHPVLRHLTGNWSEGRSNITVTGDFGFVDVDSEGDATTPVLVEELCARLVVWNLPKFGDVDEQRKGRIIRESIRDYSYQLADHSAGGAGSFGDTRIDKLFAMFKSTHVGVA